MKTISILAGAVLTTVLLSGCGGADEASDPSTRSPETTQSSEPSQVPRPAAEDIVSGFKVDESKWTYLNPQEGTTDGVPNSALASDATYQCMAETMLDSKLSSESLAGFAREGFEYTWPSGDDEIYESDVKPKFVTDCASL